MVASELAQQVKVAAVKPDDLEFNSPWTPWWKERMILASCPLTFSPVPRHYPSFRQTNKETNIEVNKRTKMETLVTVILKGIPIVAEAGSWVLPDKRSFGNNLVCPWEVLSSQWAGKEAILTFKAAKMWDPLDAALLHTLALGSGEGSCSYHVQLRLPAPPERTTASVSGSSTWMQLTPSCRFSPISMRGVQHKPWVLLVFTLHLDSKRRPICSL